MSDEADDGYEVRDLKLEQKLAKFQEEINQLREIARLVLVAHNHPSGKFGHEEIEEAADRAAFYGEKHPL